MKKIIFSALILLTVTGCATRLPEDELRLTREKMEHYLLNEARYQSEMTFISGYMRQLADMEKELIEYRIWNQPNYSQIEKAFMADCAAWDQRAAAEAQKPSEFEGGSMAPCDRNMRMTYLVEKRINELKNKWRQKCLN